MDLQSLRQSLQKLTDLQAWEAWMVPAIILVAAVAVALVVHRIVFAAARRVAARSTNTLDNALVAHARGPARLMFVIFAFFLVLPSLSIPEDTQDSIRQGLTIALTAGFGWLAVALTGIVAEVVSARYELGQPDNLLARQMHTRIRVMRRIAVAFIVVISLCLVLMSIPSIRQIGITLFASAGVAGLVVGMAARPAISNLIAGLQLALTEPIRIEDVVIVEGEWGWIEEIRPTYVVVRIWDLRRLVVPLSYFIEKPFQNWTRKTANILGTVFVYTDYTVPVEAVRSELLRILQSTKLWDGEAWGLQVTDAKEQTIELRALMSAPTSGKAWDLRCLVRERLIDYLQREYPQCLPRMRADLHRQKSEAA